jgi:hypothetical protein
MPRIIDYPIVLEEMQRGEFRCLYHNSGAFGFLDERSVGSVGWIGAVDATLKPAARVLARMVAEPIEENLAALVVRAWREHLSGPVWAMPKSHWAYELEFGSREWMPGLLGKMGIDSALLMGRNNAAAVEFQSGEEQQFQLFIQQLLTNLAGSDFLLAFVRHKTICTVHNHKQLWWTTADEGILAGLEGLAG